MLRRLLPSPTRTIETDVCVVGAGLIGLAHAHEARRRGLSVVLLEHNARATGASVRDSGHLFFSALPSGDVLDAAVPARDRWLDLARRAGLSADQGGTLMIARHRDELAVMEAAAADEARNARMRSAKKVAKLAPIPVDGVLGAFHSKLDVRIDPRAAPASLARLLAADPSSRIEWCTHVHAIESGVVHAGALRVRAGAIVACPGADHRMLPDELWPGESGLTLRQTQMLRLAAPTGRRYRQTLTTALSLLEYPGFRAQPGIRQLRDRLELETPELIERGVRPVVTQLRDGDLILGGTAAHTASPKPFSRERLDELMLDQARKLLGGSLDVRQRWSSTSVSLRRTADDFLVTRPMPGVRVVQAVGPTAVALCHWHAEKVLDELLAGADPNDRYISVHDMRKVARGVGGVRDHAAAFGAGERSQK